MLARVPRASLSMLFSGRWSATTIAPGYMKGLFRLGCRIRWPLRQRHEVHGVFFQYTLV